jgi:outer membrane receptor protein involved in Fe transport
MRPVVFALITAVSVAACDGKPLTGPAAQRAVAQAKPRRGELPAGTLVLINGVRLSANASLDELDPATVETVEVLKGDAARRLYGLEAEHGAILITTKKAASGGTQSH